ncbi:MAG: helix-turn-helix transcriptional regulator [Prevotellaceae bacterium]|nr:helix-turn-helix transcriptional regulator [Candidatus Colivivens equi]
MDTKKIAANLIKLRTDRGLTQQQTADLLGITVSAVTNYELASRVPRDEIKIKYAQLFNTSVGAIFFD